jgi:hypothetical protein
MVSGYHDLYLGAWFTLLPVAVWLAAGVQVIVPDVCQFDYLLVRVIEDPEDRPPSVLATMVSAPRVDRGVPVILAAR